MFKLAIIMCCAKTVRNQNTVVIDDSIDYLDEDSTSNNKISKVDERSIVPRKHSIKGSKPVVRSMALSFQPRFSSIASTHIVRGLALGSRPIVKKTFSKKLHIEPNINLIQSLRTLDNINQKSTATKQYGNVSSGVPDTRNLVINEKETHENIHTFSLPESKRNRDVKKKKSEFMHFDSLENKIGKSSLVTKKDANPNIITDSMIKGFLAKDANFTIEDVGKDTSKERRIHKKKRSEAKNQKLKEGHK